MLTDRQTYTFIAAFVCEQSETSRDNERENENDDNEERKRKTRRIEQLENEGDGANVYVYRSFIAMCFGRSFGFVWRLTNVGVLHDQVLCTCEVFNTYTWPRVCSCVRAHTYTRTHMNSHTYT